MAYENDQNEYPLPADGILDIDICQLIQRSLCAVVLNANTVQQTRMCASRSNLIKVMREGF